MKYVYRVDPLQTNDIVKVDKSNLHKDTPMDMWIPAAFGDGEYCYTETFEQAKEKFVEYMEALIEDVKAKIKRINNLTEEERIDD